MAQATLSKMQINSSANWALAGVSFAHLLNDAMQTVVPSAFPLFQQTMQLSFAQIGWIAFTLNITASVLQPLVGYMSDRKPMPILLPGGMLFSLIGVLGLALSSELWMLLVTAAFDSSIRLIHPPPRILTRGSYGGRPWTWNGAVNLPGGRQHGTGHCSITGRLHPAATWAA